MKIIELNFETNWRGGERQTFYTLQGWRDAGITVHLICRKNSYLRRYAQEHGFTVHSFNTVLEVFFFLIREGKNYDCIHAQTSHILTYCILAKPFYKTPVWFTRRVDFVPKGLLTKMKYRFADKIIAVSSTIKNILSEFCGRDDIEVISDIGVKTEPNVAMAKEKLAPLKIGHKRIIATTAALTGHKDPLTTVEVIKKLSLKRQDFIFLHFGSGELKDEVEETIHKNGLQNFFILMGFVPQVENFFPLFEVFIMTSQEEGLGSSVLDAFLNKIPVVSTNAGGLKELIGNDRGILCNVKDSDALAEGIDALLNNAVEKQKLIDNAFEFATQYHGMKYITEKYIDLLKKHATSK